MDDTYIKTLVERMIRTAKNIPTDKPIEKITFPRAARANREKIVLRLMRMQELILQSSEVDQSLSADISSILDRLTVLLERRA